MTQKQLILKLLEYRKDWVKSYELIKVGFNGQWIGIAGDRRARELAQVGLIDRRENGKYAEYRIKVLGQQSFI